QESKRRQSIAKFAFHKPLHMFYKSIIKPLFFCFAPERAHYLAMDLLQAAVKVPGVRGLMRSYFHVKNDKLRKTAFGLTFPNPVGLAAGFDKDARWIDALDTLGFGFIEIGTLTPVGQPGNEQPRLFRLPKDEALINRMGFNNHGVVDAVERLKKRNSSILVGGNIGKNKVTPNEDAVKDYLICFDALRDVVDYFVVNVSSPNTPGLRELQEKGPLLEILRTLQDKNVSGSNPKPILLKIAPDLTDEQLDDIIEITQTSGIAGVIATNTTIDRSRLQTDSSTLESIGAGGLSGKPVTARATEVIRYLKTKSNNAFPVIGVGGIHTGADALEKLEAGADLVQVYTGFIYEGPAIAKNINRYLVERG
ncbi:MAG: dihydroorotate dehydrogenase, partial [Bacteroidota bacterium]